MANWCINWVNLAGEPEKIEAFMQDIKVLGEESNRLDVGVSPLDEPQDGWMFDFEIDPDSFSFQSKWCPALDSLKSLAKKHGVAVTNRYEELGCGIYGQWESDGDSETDVCLTDEEIYSVEETEEDSCIWAFEGMESDCREDLLITVLERKIASKQQARNTDDKLIKVLERFLSLHEADEIFGMINDPKFEVSDVIGMLENYEDENYVNPNE